MFTQKRTLLFLTVTVILSLVLAACQAANTGEPVPVIGSGKDITIVNAEDPPSFNPIVSDTGYDALVMELVMLGLTDVDPQGNVFPELAAELPTTGLNAVWGAIGLSTGLLRLFTLGRKWITRN
jgi:ABC-type oligopeptide transport system substrate-binding subunit